MKRIVLWRLVNLPISWRIACIHLCVLASWTFFFSQHYVSEIYQGCCVLLWGCSYFMFAKECYFTLVIYHNLPIQFSCQWIFELIPVFWFIFCLFILLSMLIWLSRMWCYVSAGGHTSLGMEVLGENMFSKVVVPIFILAIDPHPL